MHMCVHVCVWMCVCVNHVSHSKIFFFFLMKSAYDTLNAGNWFANSVPLLSPEFSTRVI